MCTTVSCPSTCSEFSLLYKKKTFEEQVLWKSTCKLPNTDCFKNTNNRLPNSLYCYCAHHQAAMYSDTDLYGDLTRHLTLIRGSPSLSLSRVRCCLVCFSFSCMNAIEMSLVSSTPVCIFAEHATYSCHRHHFKCQVLFFLNQTEESGDS